MPVITRSQSKKMSSIQETNTKEDKTLKMWFLSMICRYDDEIIALNKKKINIQYTYYYDNLRLTCELCYMIEEHFPKLNNDIKYNIQLAKLIYKLIQNIYNDIHNNLVKPTTKEEKYIVNTTISQMENTEKMLIQYLEQESKMDIWLPSNASNKYKTQNTHIRFTDDDCEC